MKTQIMGVLNVTPDSFYDGGRFLRFEHALEQACLLMDYGVDILDIGAESTRPSTVFHEQKGKVENLDEDEESKRLFSILEVICKQFPTQKVSVDTRKVRIAEKSIAMGVQIINFVCEYVPEDLAKLIAKNPHVSLVICHMHGTPKTMQDGSFIKGPIVPYLKDWFREQLATLQNHGVRKEQIIFDPGIGFGKRKPDQDFEILRGIAEFKAMGYPLLIGLSRKSFMGKFLGKNADALLPATLVMNTFASIQGADILRVHDVQEHREMLSLLEQVTF